MLAEDTEGFRVRGPDCEYLGLAHSENFRSSVTCEEADLTFHIGSELMEDLS